MKSFVRNELCTDQPINLKRLSPMMKVYAGIVVRIHESKYYKNKLDARLEQQYFEQSKTDERVKDSILAMAYRELNNNKTLGERGDECFSIILSVNHRYAKSLDRILGDKDFLPYTVKVVGEDPDMRYAFPDMPTLIEIGKKVI